MTLQLWPVQSFTAPEECWVNPIRINIISISSVQGGQVLQQTGLVASQGHSRLLAGEIKERGKASTCKTSQVPTARHVYCAQLMKKA
jgi:hypothetical protein